MVRGADLLALARGSAATGRRRPAARRRARSARVAAAVRSRDGRVGPARHRRHRPRPSCSRPPGRRAAHLRPPARNALQRARPRDRGRAPARRLRRHRRHASGAQPQRSEHLPRTRRPRRGSHRRQRRPLRPRENCIIVRGAAPNSRARSSAGRSTSSSSTRPIPGIDAVQAAAAISSERWLSNMRPDEPRQSDGPRAPADQAGGGRWHFAPHGRGARHPLEHDSTPGASRDLSGSFDPF
jgi:hypothetical protein